jgi:hypothetical protein
MNSETVRSCDSSDSAEPISSIQDLTLASYESSPLEAQNRLLTRLVGKVYEDAPISERNRLLEALIRPMGVISLITVANGLFAKIKFRSAHWQIWPANLEDIQNIGTGDILALVDKVQQVTSDVITGLADVVASSPALTSSVAASVLLIMLLRARSASRVDELDP